MSKYIDAEKLIAEIKKRERIHFEDYHIKKTGTPADYGACNALCQIRSYVESLQQEQPDKNETVEVAEKFARIVRGNLIGIDKEVQQKFEQLYFEVTGNKMYRGYND